MLIAGVALASKRRITTMQNLGLGNAMSPLMFVMQKWSGVTANELPTRHDALARVIAQTPSQSTVVIVSSGFCCRELHALDDVLAAARERRAGSNGVSGTWFVRLAIYRGTPDGPPRPTITPPDVKTRLMRHIGAIE